MLPFPAVFVVAVFVAGVGGKELGENIRKKAALFQKQGLCVVEKGILRLTPAGFLASNSIIGELLW